MQGWPQIAGAAALLVGGVAFVLVEMLLALASEGAGGRFKDGALRRPSPANRRRYHRSLLKTGYVVGVMSLGAALFWAAVATNGRSDNEADARAFAWLTLGLATLAICLLAGWWRLASKRAVRQATGFTLR